jgi:prevent-host-death family protein
MSDVTLADAKAQLSDLVERATRGEPVQITRRGKPVARIVGIARRPKPIDLAALKALTDAMPLQSEPTRTWLRGVRDGSRY